MKTCKELYKETFNNVTAPQELKEKLITIPNDINPKKSKKTKRITVVLVAAIIAVLSSVGAYAGVSLYNMYSEEKGQYAETMVLDKNQSTLSLDKQPNVKHLKYVNLDFKYLPKNLVPLKNTNNSKYCFKDSYGVGGMSLILYDVSNTKEIRVEHKNIIDSEVTTINGSKVMYLREKIYKKSDKENPQFDKQFYMYFSDYDSLLWGWAGTDISKKELYKILESATLSEGNRGNSIDYIKWSDDKTSDESMENQEVVNNVDYSYSENYNKFINVGDNTNIDTYDFDGNNVSVNMKIDNIDVSDDMSMMPDSFKSKYLDSKGKIKPYTVDCYGGGDGINSLSELKETKKIKLKYIYETVTYKNTSDKDIKDMLVYHSLVNKDGTSIVRDIDKLWDKYESVDEINMDDYNLTEWVYDDFSRENTNNPNYIDIPAKSSVTIHIGYFVPESQVTDQLCISADCDSGYYMPALSNNYIHRDETLVYVNKQ